MSEVDSPPSGGDLLCHRYRLVEQLGSGGMSVVWRSYDEVLGRQVAVKVLGPELASDPVFVRRLRQEAQAAARLSHPSITSVHDYGESHDPDGTVRPFVVMELLEGQSLRSVLARGRRLPWRRVVTIGAEVASALAVAHARGIVHRDISSGNVMLTPTGARVVDFGISALIGEREPVDEDNNIMGTPAYVAPERLDGVEVTPAVDTYALGVLLYRALSGNLPWAAESTTDLLDAHQWLRPTPLPPLAGLPPRVVQLCYRCLSKNPADRPSSAEVAVTLAKIARVPVAVPPFASAENTKEAVAHRKTAVLPWLTRHRGAAARGPVPAPTRETLPDLARSLVAAPRGRMLLSLAGLAAIILVFFGLSSLTGVDKASPAGATCEVTYAQTRDSGGTFDAAVTVHNSGPEAVERWQLEFGLPGDQKVVASRDGTWDQHGQQVIMRPGPDQGVLASGGSHRFQFSGEYENLNALPGSFALAGTPCQAVVLGPTAVPQPPVPPQPVQHDGASDTGADDGRGPDGKHGKRGRGGDGDDDDGDKRGGDRGARHAHPDPPSIGGAASGP